MIVTITLPVQTARVVYGQASFMPDENHQIEVPQYVAKTILGLDGVIGATISQPVAELLGQVEDEFELNYLFLAHGRPVPMPFDVPHINEETNEPILDDDGRQVVTVAPSDIAAKAAALLADRGEPSAALS